MSQPDRFPSEDASAAPLGKPLKFEFSGLTAQNRFMKAAMTERLSSWDPKNFEARGIPSKELINVYREWGAGEWGVILTGNIMIEFDQLEAEGNPIIPRTADFTGERFVAFKALATEAKKHGSLIVGQVSHPGRQVHDGIQKDPISASDIQLEGELMGMHFAKPHAASTAEIQRVVDGFAHAAEFLHKAGYNGIQLHGAHGYLLAQFLAETTNKRTDKYGGSLENRQRLILEISEEIRKRVPKEFSISIKVNSVEFQAGGFPPEDCAKLCTALEENGFDFVELSGGTYQSLAFLHKRESTRKRESFFIEFAEQIVPQLKKTKVYVVGGLRTVGAMTDALKTVQGVSLARPACQEFDLPKEILSGKVKGAIHAKIDQDNFGMTNLAAGTQIRQVGKGEKPLDLSQQKNVDIFNNSVNQWMQEMSENQSGTKYGYIDLIS